jgi:VWFA-related protein
MTRALRIGVFGLVATVPVLRAAPSSQSTPTSGDVRSMVVATDPTGQPVRDLRADEIRVFEDDALQPQPRVERRTAPNGRSVVLLIDDLHVQPADTILARRAIELVRDVVLKSSDRVAIVSTGLSSIAQDLVYDPQYKRVNAAIAKVMGSADPLMPATAPGASPSHWNETAGLAFHTAGDILRALAARPDLDAALFYVSSGYRFNPYTGRRLDQALSAPAPSGLFDKRTGLTDTDLIARLAQVVATARRGSVAIYSIDPRGLTKGPNIADRVTPDEWRAIVEEQLTGLRALAEVTGGLCLCSTNDFRTPLARVDAGLDDHYLVTYRSTDPDPRKIHRRVRIETTRAGVTLRYAPSYFRE